MPAILKRCKYFGLSPTIFGVNKVTKRNPRVSRNKLSEYGQQLKEKQKLKFIYGLREKQFRKYFEIASRNKNKTGEILLQTLESRLDNTVFRLGFARTRREARQLVGHSHFLVNGKKVNIPSYMTKIGDIIEFRPKSKNTELFKSIVENFSKIIVSPWLEVNSESFIGKVLRVPSVGELDIPVDVGFVIVLYSR